MTRNNDATSTFSLNLDIADQVVLWGVSQFSILNPKFKTFHLLSDLSCIHTIFNIFFVDIYHYLSTNRIGLSGFSNRPNHPTFHQETGLFFFHYHFTLFFFRNLHNPQKNPETLIIAAVYGTCIFHPPYFPFIFLPSIKELHTINNIEYHISWLLM